MCGLAAFLLLAVADAQVPAASDVPDHIQYVRDEMGRFEQTTLSKWRRSSQLSFALVVAVALFGAVAAALSQPQRRAYRHVASVLGVAVAVLAAVQEYGFTADHRALDLLAARAEQDLADIRLLASPRYNSFDTKDLEDEWWENVRTSLARLHALELEALAPAKASAISLAGLVPRARAADSRPAWAARPPPDAGTISFVGEGLGSDLPSARAASRASAEARARAHLVAAIPAGAKMAAADRDRLAAFLVQAGRVSATYTEYSGGKYRHFSLLRLNRASLRTDALMFGVREKVTVTASTAEAIASGSPGP